MAKSDAGPRHDPSRRSCCPVACALDVIGDRWSLLIIRDLLAGKERFAQFERGPERIATNILTARLKALAEAGLVERRASPAGGHARYYLTAKGTSLRPVLASLANWGLTQIDDTKALITAQ